MVRDVYDDAGAHDEDANRMDDGIEGDDDNSDDGDDGDDDDDVHHHSIQRYVMNPDRTWQHETVPLLNPSSSHATNHSTNNHHNGEAITLQEDPSIVDSMLMNASFEQTQILQACAVGLLCAGVMCLMTLLFLGWYFFRW